jgi:hypothetical protein
MSYLLDNEKRDWSAYRQGAIPSTSGEEPPVLEGMNHGPRRSEQDGAPAAERPLRSRSYLSAVTVIEGDIACVLGGRKLEWNEMVGAPELGRVLVNDADVSVIRAEIERRITVGKDRLGRPLGLALSASDVHAAVIQLAHAAPYHPVREYLSSLQWDGARRIQRVPSEIFRADPTDAHLTMTEKWFIAAVARPLSPGARSIRC